MLRSGNIHYDRTLQCRHAIRSNCLGNIHCKSELNYRIQSKQYKNFETRRRHIPRLDIDTAPSSDEITTITNATTLLCGMCFRVVEGVIHCRCWGGRVHSWYHFLSLYLSMSWCAEPENCAASLDMRSVRSSSCDSLSPRSRTSWWALDTCGGHTESNTFLRFPKMFHFQSR